MNNKVTISLSLQNELLKPLYEQCNTLNTTPSFIVNHLMRKRLAVPKEHVKYNIGQRQKTFSFDIDVLDEIRLQSCKRGMTVNKFVREVLAEEFKLEVVK